jgi:hypothetical protein
MTKPLLACWFIAAVLSLPVHAGWVKAQAGQTPPNAIVAGKSRDGQPFYVCRAQYEGGIYPGTLASPSQECRIPYEGKEYSFTNYEVLAAGNYNWIAVYSGDIPFDAMPAGREQQGNILYICRGEINSEWHPGKIRHASSGCSVPYAGKELTAPWYEVLVGN